MLINAAPTQIAAHHAHRASGGAQYQHEAILEFMAQRGGDWVISELAEELPPKANGKPWKDSVVSARVNELIKLKKVVVRDSRPSRTTGIQSRPVALPVGQQSLFQ